MTAAGSVASPSRLGNNAVRTWASPGGGDRGPTPTLFGAVTQDNPPALGAHPYDTGAEPDTYYLVEKQYRYDNTAALQAGQMPVPYNPALSRTLDSGGAKPSVPFTFDVKTYDNASWRRTFGAWRQRFPNESAPPGEGMWKVSNPYYPSNMPSQLAASTQSAPGTSSVQRGQAAIITPFVVVGGRGMGGPYSARQTRLAPSISYSSTTPVVGQSVFTDYSLGGG